MVAWLVDQLVALMAVPMVAKLDQKWVDQRAALMADKMVVTSALVMVAK